MVGQSLGDRQTIPSPNAPGVGWLAMDRHRIVYGGPDPIALKGLLQGRSIFTLQHKEMHRVRGAGNDRRSCQLRNVDGLAIPLSDLTTALIASIQMWKFDSENRRLKFIES